VAGGIVGRGAEQAAVQVLLDDVGDGPVTLALWGEAGIGKTTIWAAGVAAADLRGHTVFQCRPAIAEIRLTYAGLTDLLVHVDEALLDDLPGPQRVLWTRRCCAAPRATRRPTRARWRPVCCRCSIA
jgi:hypothetical protein